LKKLREEKNKMKARSAGRGYDDIKPELRDYIKKMDEKYLNKITELRQKGKGKGKYLIGVVKELPQGEMQFIIGCWEDYQDEIKKAEKMELKGIEQAVFGGMII
jgi:hypothetical protein